MSLTMTLFESFKAQNIVKKKKSLKKKKERLSGRVSEGNLRETFTFDRCSKK